MTKNEMAIVQEEIRLNKNTMNEVWEEARQLGICSLNAYWRTFTDENRKQMVMEKYYKAEGRYNLAIRMLHGR